MRECREPAFSDRLACYLPCGPEAGSACDVRALCRLLLQRHVVVGELELGAGVCALDPELNLS